MPSLSFQHPVVLTHPISQAVFGMNVIEINPGSFGTLAHYFEAAFPLTFLTTWIIVAFQSDSIFQGRTGINWMHRLCWPWYLIQNMLGWNKKKEDKAADEDDDEDSYAFSVLGSPSMDKNRGSFS